MLELWLRLRPQVWVKDIVSHIKLSNWGLVFYNNALSFILSMVTSLFSNEGGMLRSAYAAFSAALTPAGMPPTFPESLTLSVHVRACATVHC